MAPSPPEVNLMSPQTYIDAQLKFAAEWRKAGKEAVDIGGEQHAPWDGLGTSMLLFDQIDLSVIPPESCDVLEKLDSDEEDQRNDTEVDAQVDTEVDAQVDTEADAQADTEADAQVDTEADAQVDTEADAQVDTEADAQVNDVLPRIAEIPVLEDGKVPQCCRAGWDLTDLKEDLEIDFRTLTFKNDHRLSGALPFMTFKDDIYDVDKLQDEFRKLMRPIDDLLMADNAFDENAAVRHLQMIYIYPETHSDVPERAAENADQRLRARMCKYLAKRKRRSKFFSQQDGEIRKLAMAQAHAHALCKTVDNFMESFVSAGLPRPRLAGAVETAEPGAASGQAGAVEADAPGAASGQADAVEANTPGAASGQTGAIEADAPGAASGRADAVEADARGAATGRAGALEANVPGAASGHADATEADEPGATSGRADASESDAPGAASGQANAVEADAPGATSGRAGAMETDARMATSGQAGAMEADAL
eukprot:gene24659-30001_t